MLFSVIETAFKYIAGLFLKLTVKTFKKRPFSNVYLQLSISLNFLVEGYGAGILYYTNDYLFFLGLKTCIRVSLGIFLGRLILDENFMYLEFIFLELS